MAILLLKTELRTDIMQVQYCISILYVAAQWKFGGHKPNHSTKTSINDNTTLLITKIPYNFKLIM